MPHLERTNREYLDKIKNKRILMQSTRKATQNIPREKTLQVTPWFKQFIKKNSKIIKDFLIARKILIKGNPTEPIKQGNITIQRLYLQGNMHCYLYKVISGKKIFFIKEHEEEKQKSPEITRKQVLTTFYPKVDLAKPQIKTLEQAKEILKKYKHLDVVEYYLGWTYGKNSFLVTKNYDCVNASTIKNTIPGKILVEYSIANRELKKNNIYDFGWSNALWDPKKQKLLIFDLRSG